MRTQILQHIENNGPISVSEYMAMCLYTDKAGYYMKGMPFGKDGDFITAPELTPLFGEMLGLWVAATWQQMGAPETFTLVECGPGRGTLFADMLRAISKALPACANALEGHLVEISPNLKAYQQNTLKDAPCPITWHSHIGDIPNSTPMIVIGNELLDAFPVNQYELKDGKYYERLVTAHGDELAFVLSDTPTDIEAYSTDVVEISPAMDNFLEELRVKLSDAPQAALLLLDYGATFRTSGETLQALRKHTVEGIFDTPGDADLTWHIPFAHVCDILGTIHSTMTDMALFLSEIGYALRAEQAFRAAETEEEKEHIASTTKRLLDPNEMGAHFKVLGWVKDEKTEFKLQGFHHRYADSE